jgi:hypothetical protein
VRNAASDALRHLRTKLYDALRREVVGNSPVSSPGGDAGQREIGLDALHFVVTFGTGSEPTGYVGMVVGTSEDVGVAIEPGEANLDWSPLFYRRDVGCQAF